MTLRRDPRASFQSISIPPGCLGWLRGDPPEVQWYLTAGKYSWPTISDGDYQILIQNQETIAVAVGSLPELRRTYWMFKGQIYWDDEGHAQREITALLLARQDQLRRRIDRAIARQEGALIAAEQEVRAPIPDDVKMFVWQRDGGKCVKCGSKSDLEFDHIIPISLGGSSTARNLQLLCATCNRSKGASIS
jgi:hypothetical protein